MHTADEITAIQNGLQSLSSSNRWSNRCCFGSSSSGCGSLPSGSFGRGGFSGGGPGSDFGCGGLSSDRGCCATSHKQHTCESKNPYESSNLTHVLLLKRYGLVY